MRVVFLADESATARAASLQAWLDRVDGLAVQPAGDVGIVARLNPGEVLVALVDDYPLSPAAEQAVVAHLGRGGGLVLLGPTLHAWRDAITLTGQVGKPGERQARTELVVEVAAHPALRRLDPALVVTDDAWLDAGIPGDAGVWLRTRWHYRDHALGWACGRAVVLTLGGSPEACAADGFARLVLRAIRQAAGRGEPPEVRVGMLGYGAIGAEHAAAIAAVDGLHLVAVCDRDPGRLEQAATAFGHVRLLTDARDLADANTVDLVLVSVPPNRHAEAATTMLRAGKHVVVEKPYALTTAEADAIIDAVPGGRTLTVYQNRRWDPDFRAVQTCVQSGGIGEVFHVETFVGGFSHPCQYWHSHEPVSGGLLYDWGSHYVDWILQLVDAPVVAVSGWRHKRVWRDVTNADMARVRIRFAGGQEAEFIHSDVAAAAKPKWYVLGTRGAVTAQWREERLLERARSGEIVDVPLARTDAQADVRVHTPDGRGGAHVKTLALPPWVDAPFYRNLADHLLVGEPLAVTADQARRTTAVLEAACRSVRQDARPVSLAV